MEWRFIREQINYTAQIVLDYKAETLIRFVRLSRWVSLIKYKLSTKLTAHYPSKSDAICIYILQLSILLFDQFASQLFHHQLQNSDMQTFLIVK